MTPRCRSFGPAKNLFRHLMSRSAAEGAERFEFLGRRGAVEARMDGPRATSGCSFARTRRRRSATPGRAAETVYLRFGKPLARRALARVR